MSSSVQQNTSSCLCYPCSVAVLGTRPGCENSPNIQGKHGFFACLPLEVEVNLLVYGLRLEYRLLWNHPEMQVTNSPDCGMRDQEPESLSSKRLRSLGPLPGTHIDYKDSLALTTAGDAKTGTPVSQLG